jgi:hypothetical protein
MASPATATVTVQPAPAVISSFAAGLGTLTAGDATTLSWSTSGASSCSLLATDGTYYNANNTPQSVALSDVTETGALTITSITTNGTTVNNTYTATLTCLPAGPNSTATATVTVLAPNQLINPQGLAFANGNLYVANTGGGNVLVYAESKLGNSGNLFQQYNQTLYLPSQPPNYPFPQPVALAFDSSENLYVADTAANAIFVFSPNTYCEDCGYSQVATIDLPPPPTGNPTPSLNVTGVAVDSQGTVYVSTTVNPNNESADTATIYAYPAVNFNNFGTTYTGAPTATWTADSTGSFSEVFTLTYDANTDLLYAGISYTGSDSEVVAYQTLLPLDIANNGSPPAVLPVAQTISNSYVTGPSGIAVDGDFDNIFVANAYFANNYEIEAPLSPVAEFNNGSQVSFSLQGTPNPPLATPTGVAVGNANIYVSDPTNNSIDIYPNSTTSLCANAACVTEPSVSLNVPPGTTYVSPGSTLTYSFSTLGLPASVPAATGNCTQSDNNGSTPQSITAPTSSLPGAQPGTFVLTIPDAYDYTVYVSCSGNGATTPTASASINYGG